MNIVTNKRKYVVKRDKRRRGEIKSDLTKGRNPLPLNQELVHWRNPNGIGSSAIETAAAIATYIRLNDLYDPFVTGGANMQPSGYDQLTPSMMWRYKVVKGCLFLHIGTEILASGRAQECYLCYYMATSVTPATTLRIAQGQPGAVTKSIKPFGSTYVGESVDIVVPFNMDKWFDDNTMQKTAYNASPTNILYLHILLFTADAAEMSSGTFYWSGEIKQSAIMDRLNTVITGS